MHDFRNFVQVVENQQNDSAFQAGYEGSIPSTRSILLSLSSLQNTAELQIPEWERKVGKRPPISVWILSDLQHVFPRFFEFVMAAETSPFVFTLHSGKYLFNEVSRERGASFCFLYSLRSTYLT